MNTSLILIFALISLSASLPTPNKPHGGLIGSGKSQDGKVANLGIVNGVKSKSMKPYLASLREVGDHICGATILDEYTIVTAAHCLQKEFPASLYTVGVGNQDLSNQTIYNVVKYVNNEKFDEDFDYNNDVAIIKLEKPIKMVQNLVAPIKFTDCKEDLPYGKKCLVAGWGAQHENDENYVNELYETEVNVLKNTDGGCAIYEKEKKLSDTMFCAGFANGKTDSCQGDSGGPLVNKYNEFIGIVSWGRGCSRVGVSGVYTSVCKVKAWIENAWHAKN